MFSVAWFFFLVSCEALEMRRLIVKFALVHALESDLLRSVTATGDHRECDPDGT